MKRTGVLKILHDTAFPVNKLVIHPNTGFDLGFMQLKYNARLCINTGIEDFKSGCSDALCDAEIMLLNNCRPDVVEMSAKLWEKMGKPVRCLLVYEDTNNRLLIAGS